MKKNKKINKKINQCYLKKVNPECLTTNCPLCNKPISVFPGTRDALCRNCGYKEPCCD